MSEAEKRELKRQISQYESTYKTCKNTAIIGAVALGAAAVIVTLFIPGWSLPVKILLAAEGVPVVLGGIAAYNHSQMNQAQSKFERSTASAQPAASPANQLDQLLEQVTESQCKRNLQLYNEWLVNVKQALISECGKLSAM